MSPRTGKKLWNFCLLSAEFFCLCWFPTGFPNCPEPAVLASGEWVKLIPVLRPATSDLNLTLAMAVFVVLLSHFLGIIAIGFFKYANKFIKLGDLYSALKSFNPVKIFVALIEFFVGFLEIISEVAKMVSLQLAVIRQHFRGRSSPYGYRLPGCFFRAAAFFGPGTFSWDSSGDGFWPADSGILNYGHRSHT